MKPASKGRALRLVLLLCNALFLHVESSPLDLALPKLELPGHWGRGTRESASSTEDEGISDDDLKLAYDDLSSVLDKSAPLPREMKVLAAGTLSGSAKTTWKVHGMEDEKTGLFQTLYVCHFKGIPMHIMERCVLDETYQLTYDEFTAQKRVLALRGAGDRSLVGSQKARRSGQGGPFGLPALLSGCNPLDISLPRNPIEAARMALHQAEGASEASSDLKRNGSQERSTHERGHRVDKGGPMFGMDRVAKGGLSCSEVIYQESRYPGPMQNRDYVYYRRRHIRPYESVTYVHRDVPPGKASKYVSPRLGIVRAGNGLYWQFGLIRAERSSEEESEGRGRSPLASQEPGSLNFNDQDTTIGRGSGRAKSRGTPVLGSDAAAGGGVSSKSRDAEASSSSIGNGSASASSRHMASSPSCDGCSVVSRCEDNVEGSMPKWLMSVMASKGAPTYVNTLQRAAVRLMLQDGLVTESEARERWQYS